MEQVRDMSAHVLVKPSAPTEKGRDGGRLGTAVHASIEDLLQVDLAGRKSGETHWLPEMAEKFETDGREEKEIFFATPRRPMWKEKSGIRQSECSGVQSKCS